MTRRRCEVEGCEKVRFGHGYCNAHYKRWRRYGDPLAGRAPVRPDAVCGVPDCVRPLAARGLCNTHYARWSVAGDDFSQDPIRPANFRQLKGPCLRPDCTVTSLGSGYCRKHYARMRVLMSYGLDGWDGFDALWGLSEGKCGVCGDPLDQDGGINTHVDHDHETGEVRGLLCRGCNHGLGHFCDDPERLRKAVTYLERSR